MRCALVEFNAYHEETLPTFVHLLNELGIEPDVYMTRRSMRRDPFGLTHKLRYRLHRAERIDWLRGLRFRMRRYELLIVNSMEPPANTQRLMETRTPVVGTMHNTALLAAEPVYRDFFAGPHRLPLVLGRHIATWFAQAGQRLPWVLHVYFGRLEQRRTDPRPARPTTFAVSGNVEFTRRNYDGLLDAVAELMAEGAPIKVRIVGRSTNRDGQVLRQRIEQRGLSSAFELSSHETSHPEFFQLLADCDFVLPLLDHSAEHLGAYFETKLASSVPFAIGLGVPLVMHDDLASAYGVEACGIGHAEGGLASAMRAAVASTTSDRDGWRAALDIARAEILAASLTNLREAIATAVS
ncbi:MAG: hypothetical protein QOI92_816 [Chloroflexota bacterium]|jgi:glycosyltransferase involved in cell wall biosynthesis|nr:hypothetical protein [Chloroflexota bacterium]